MDKRRLGIFLTIILTIIALYGVYYFSTSQKQEPAPVFPATVNRDCAPWDGAAFTVLVQFDSATVIYISIWRSPEMKFPSAFSFPDETGQVGNAYILPEPGPYTLLNGKVSFQRVQAGTPLEGRFMLTSGRGETYEGSFIAEWGDQIVYCG